MISFSPTLNRLGRLAGQRSAALTSLAGERWEIGLRMEIPVPPAIVLPGQIDRIKATEFATLPETICALLADGEVVAGVTTAYLLRDVDLVDGVLYKGDAELHLRQRRRLSPLYLRPKTEISAAMYESWVGNRYFGNWLMDDCQTYDLAAAAGNPVTTVPPGSGHVPRYEELLGMAPCRIGDVHFRDLVIFDDLPNSADRVRRASEMREKLLNGRHRESSPGVFLLRGGTGDQRLLVNENELADRLARERGFLILDHTRMSVDELIDACAGAHVVAGVEGSQLVHGQIVAAPGSMLLTIQPPDRVTAAMKLMTDRLQQHFGLVVAHGNLHRFHVDSDEVLRTLDLHG